MLNCLKVIFYLIYFGFFCLKYLLYPATKNILPSLKELENVDLKTDRG